MANHPPRAQPPPRPSPPGRRDRGPGPIVLVLPLLTLILVLLWLRHGHRPAPPPSPQPPPAEGAREVAGWAGSAEPAPGLRLVVHLSPLHEDPVRADHDRRALAAHLGREEGGGRPWRLVLEYRGPPEAGGSSPGEGEGEPGPELGSLESGPLELGDVVVVDGAGGRLVPAVGVAPSPGPRRPADPLLTLLAPPPGPLTPGHGVTLVLWGEVPGPDPRLEGLGAEIPLHPQTLSAADLTATLARLDRGPTGGDRGEGEGEDSR